MTPKFSGWRKSSYSDPDGKCVQVARSSSGTVGVRDTKELDRGPILELTSSEWTAFLTAIRAGS
ncbi:DUF397 domain-containing protein [Actinomadura sp. 7K507]|uniref:DUF397 domain-containing protein n=1 Tax=Actinomadura sp. 7K507 TaxID=2530365 RepID=UPI001051D148|nr:DUF397 domain-containing protein [Actinomadura sp. 7K507]TDC97714.1 DUF397 domain-containing protein [Actinomadura sp. 7K507]